MFTYIHAMSSVYMHVMLVHDDSFVVVYVSLMVVEDKDNHVKRYINEGV